MSNGILKFVQINIKHLLYHPTTLKVQLITVGNSIRLKWVKSMLFFYSCGKDKQDKVQLYYCAFWRDSDFLALAHSYSKTLAKVKTVLSFRFVAFVWRCFRPVRAQTNSLYIYKTTTESLSYQLPLSVVLASILFG